MVRCSFCEHPMAPGTGKLYVKKEGKVLYFCSRKCEKYSVKHGRKAVKLKWTHASQRTRIKKE